MTLGSFPCYFECAQIEDELVQASAPPLPSSRRSKLIAHSHASNRRLQLDRGISFYSEESNARCSEQGGEGGNKNAQGQEPGLVQLLPAPSRLRARPHARKPPRSTHHVRRLGNVVWRMRCCVCFICVSYSRKERCTVVIAGASGVGMRDAPREGQGCAGSCTGPASREVPKRGESEISFEAHGYASRALREGIRSDGWERGRLANATLAFPWLDSPHSTHMVRVRVRGGGDHA